MKDNELLAAIARGKGSRMELMTENGRRAYVLLGSFGKADGMPRTYHLLAPESGMSPAEVWCLDITPDDVYAAREDDAAVVAKVYALYKARGKA